MKEVINKLKQYNLLYLKDLSNQREYDFCIEVFRKWCLYVNYIYNEESFYWFISEFDTVVLFHYDMISTKKYNIYAPLYNVFCSDGLSTLIKKKKYHLWLDVEDFEIPF